MRRRAALKKPEPLGQVLQKALKKRKVPIDLEERRILSFWDRSVGPQIAAQTCPSHLKGKTLFVTVSTSVWMQQLSFLKPDIIGKFNALAQRAVIGNIFFSLGRITRPSAEPPELPPFPEGSPVLKQRDRQMIAECTESIADEELRAILQRVMTKELTHRRIVEVGKDP